MIFIFAHCNTNPTISKISFQADACFGECPIFAITILKDGTAYYNAKMFNKQQGHFQTVIKNSQLDSLRELIYKVNLFSLKDKYSAPITDQPTYTLKVQFDNGQQKTIEDYGNNGPDKLDKIYDLIFALRENQDWK
ncbi:MAG: hypothetical protein BGP13_13130 [Sphingobacteriales bacterium 40-81]|nr:MAG: hypothetical protein BGP13_13130 [Sphingobacteriales bacterium 40-81]